MPREDSFTKARRYLVEARLRIRTAGNGTVTAECRGDNGVVYHLGCDDRSWFCNCPAITEQCAHVRALKLVVLQPLPGQGPGP